MAAGDGVEARPGGSMGGVEMAAGDEDEGKLERTRENGNRSNS